MSYDFFAFLNRMKYIERWSLMRNTSSENIMQHSAQVAQIAYALGVINNMIFGGNVDSEKLCTMAVFHDISEVITGDLPTPIKNYNKELNHAYKDLESQACQMLLSKLPSDLSKEFENIVIPPNEDLKMLALLKGADKLSAYIKCLEEKNSGNLDFVKAEQKIMSELLKNENSEIQYFMSNFLNSFDKTLDELN